MLEKVAQAHACRKQKPHMKPHMIMQSGAGVEPLDVQQPAQHTEVRSQLKWRFPNYYRQYGYD